MHVYMQYSTGCVDINIYSDKAVYTRVCIRTYRHMYVHAYILIQVNAVSIIPYALSFVLIYVYLYTYFPSPTNTEL